jgi:50S ribosomal subunit-associated GTPase HflX
MNQITRPRMVLFPPMPPLSAISARLEDLPPPLCAWASLTLRTATSADHVLLVADGADEAAREAEHILRGDKDAAAYRLMAKLLHEAVEIIKAQRKEG